LDLIVPYQLYQIAHSLRLEPTHGELVRQHPLAFVRLVNALIDPMRIPTMPISRSCGSRSVIPIDPDHGGVGA